MCQSRTCPCLPDLVLLISSIKSEPVPPLSVSKHSSLIGNGFGFDKVSEMTSTIHFITWKEKKIQIKPLLILSFFGKSAIKAKMQPMMAQMFSGGARTECLVPVLPNAGTEGTS